MTITSGLAIVQELTVNPFINKGTKRGIKITVPTETKSMNAAVYDRDGDDLHYVGLYLDMQPWQYHFFEMKKIS